MVTTLARTGVASDAAKLAAARRPAVVRTQGMTLVFDMPQTYQPTVKPRLNNVVEALETM
jgi:hypothetical protein